MLTPLNSGQRYCDLIRDGRFLTDTCDPNKADFVHVRELVTNNRVLENTRELNSIRRVDTSRSFVVTRDIFRPTKINWSLVSLITWFLFSFVT